MAKCTSCKSRESSFFKRCEPCRAAIRTRDAELRRFRLKLGQCKCGRRLAKDRKSCRRCLKAISNHRAKVQANREMDGLCPPCGKRPPAKDRKSCRQCLDRASAWARRTKPWKRKVRIGKHWIRWKDKTLGARVAKWRKAQIAKGNCKICGKKAHTDPRTGVRRKRCRYHLRLDAKRVASQRSRLDPNKARR
jgi:hypothetical protein